MRRVASDILSRGLDPRWGSRTIRLSRASQSCIVSAGDGLNWNTVEHLFVRYAFRVDRSEEPCRSIAVDSQIAAQREKRKRNLLFPLSMFDIRPALYVLASIVLVIALLALRTIQTILSTHSRKNWPAPRDTRKRTQNETATIALFLGSGASIDYEIDLGGLG